MDPCWLFGEPDGDETEAKARVPNWPWAAGTCPWVTLEVLPQRDRAAHCKTGGANFLPGVMYIEDDKIKQKCMFFI